MKEVTKETFKVMEKWLHFASWSVLTYMIFCAAYNGFFGRGEFKAIVDFNNFGEFWIEIFLFPVLALMTLRSFVLECKKGKKK